MYEEMIGEVINEREIVSVPIGEFSLSLTELELIEQPPEIVIRVCKGIAIIKEYSLQTDMIDDALDVFNEIVNAVNSSTESLKELTEKIDAITEGKVYKVESNPFYIS